MVDIKAERIFHTRMPDGKTVCIGTENQVREMLLTADANNSRRLREMWMWETMGFRKGNPPGKYSKITNSQDVIKNLEQYASEHPEDRDWSEKRIAFWREKRQQVAETEGIG